MSAQTLDLDRFNRFTTSQEHIRLMLEATQRLQYFAMYLRMYYGEYLLYEVRGIVHQPGIRRWYDAYEMAIHRAERADTVMRKFEVLDAFYLDMLTTAFGNTWLKAKLQRLQKDGAVIMLMFFERECGERHHFFPTLTRATTVQFDTPTALLLDDERNGFTHEDIRRLNAALKHRAGVTYFDGIMDKDVPLALQPISRFDPDRIEKQRAMFKTHQPPRSGIKRLLGWFTSSQTAAS